MAALDRLAERIQRERVEGEIRFLATLLTFRFGMHVERGERDRIISARQASRAEREVYESGGTR